MKKVIVVWIILLAISACNQESTVWQIAPFPNSIKLNSGQFKFKKDFSITISDPSLQPSVDLFCDKMEDMGIMMDPSSRHSIEIILLPHEKMNDEGYQLLVGKKSVSLKAQNPAGVYYGLMTIWQQVQFSENNALPSGMIEDQPRFAYRGFMLDESRHFFGKEKVKEIIDMMAVFKLNTFHWHLTDDPGWRIEIKSLPKLASIGGMGDYSDPDLAARYYTQEEIQEIVEYASRRFVTIVPEIDMPGHARAANRAYPEFSGGGSEKHPDFTFNPGKKETYGYLTQILAEVSELFPSDYIHLGGDEVHFGNEQWNSKKEIKSLMARENIETLKELEHYFLRRMADSVKVLGKKVAGWDEVTESGIDKDDLLIYWWRHDKPGYLERSLNGGYKTVLCPRVPLYFDFVQNAAHDKGRQWGGNFGRLEDVYQYPEAFHNFSNEDEKNIFGIQGNLWTERISEPNRLDFMTYPRFFALAESAWTQPVNKDFVRFQSLLPFLYVFLDESGLNYYNYLEEEKD